MSENNYPAQMREESEQATRWMRKAFAEPEPAPPSDDIKIIKRELAETKAEVERLSHDLETLTGINTPFAGHRVVLEIAKKHRLTYRELISNRRQRNLVVARHEAAYEIRKRTKLSLPQIGKILGDRDHTTILHAIRAHQKRSGSCI